MTYQEYFVAVICSRLRKFKGNVVQAAYSMNMKPSALRRSIKQLGITDYKKTKE